MLQATIIHMLHDVNTFANNGLQPRFMKKEHDHLQSLT